MTPDTQSTIHLVEIWNGNFPERLQQLQRLHFKVSFSQNYDAPMNA